MVIGFMPGGWSVMAANFNAIDNEALFETRWTRSFGPPFFVVIRIVITRVQISIISERCRESGCQAFL